jgi:N-acetyl-anhydromuramyl-L-alanine amidase AmpD
MQILQKASPNFSAGRGGKKIIAIVNHQTAGQGPGALSWLCNPASKASAHYLVLRDGTVYQLVKDQDTAWHAGGVNKPSWALYDGTNPNRHTIGIEHECYPAVGGDGNLTEAQYRATLELHRQLIKAYGIPVDRDHIIGHCQIDSVNRPNCPGAGFPWDRLMKDLKGDEDMKTPAKIVVNGKDLQGYILADNLSYAPVRALAEALGAKVGWNDKTKTVTITK